MDLVTAQRLPACELCVQQQVGCIGLNYLVDSQLQPQQTRHVRAQRREVALDRIDVIDLAIALGFLLQPPDNNMANHCLLLISNRSSNCVTSATPKASALGRVTARL